MKLARRRGCFMLGLPVCSLNERPIRFASAGVTATGCEPEPSYRARELHASKYMELLGPSDLGQGKLRQPPKGQVIDSFA